MVNFSYDLGQIGGSVEKKIQSWAKNVIRLHIALNWGRKMFFTIQKANLVDIQSSRFWWYSFVFERMQTRLVLYWIHVNKLATYDIVSIKVISYGSRKCHMSHTYGIHVHILKTVVNNLLLHKTSIAQRHNYIWSLYPTHKMPQLLVSISSFTHTCYPWKLLI